MMRELILALDIGKVRLGNKYWGACTSLINNVGSTKSSLVNTISSLEHFLSHFHDYNIRLCYNNYILLLSVVCVNFIVN